MLKDMEFVYAVYQERSFSRAAKKLFISQPALSTAIKRVETEINLPLFDRSTTPLSLTPAGEYYIKSIEQIMAIQKDMTAYFETLSNQNRGLINIGSSTYCCTYVLPDIIQEFQTTYPDIRVNLIEASSTDLINQLRSGSLDLILDAGSPMESSFREIPFEEEEIILSVPSSYPINRKLAGCRLTPDMIRSGQYHDPLCPSVSLNQFSDEPFLFLKKGNDMFTRGLAMCKDAGFKPYVSMYVDQMLTAYYLSCEKKGIAFIRASIIQHVERTSRICLYKIDSPLSLRRLTFSYKNGSTASQAVSNFIKFIQPKALPASAPSVSFPSAGPKNPPQ